MLSPANADILLWSVGKPKVGGIDSIQEGERAQPREQRVNLTKLRNQRPPRIEAGISVIKLP